MKVILMVHVIQILLFHPNWIAYLLIVNLLFFQLSPAWLFPIYASFLLLLFLLTDQVFRSREQITPWNLVYILLLIDLSLQMNHHRWPSLLILCLNLPHFHYLHLNLLCLWIFKSLVLIFLLFSNSFFLNLLLHNL